MDEEPNLIFRKSVEVRAIPDRRGRFQARAWFDSLSLRDRKRAQAGLRSFDVGFESKRGYAGRLEKIQGSKTGLFELKLTRGGTPGPQLRFLGVWRGGTFFVARGVMKTSRAIKRADVRAADAVVSEWGADPSRERRRKA
jgi:hypothetical protein